MIRVRRVGCLYVVSAKVSYAKRKGLLPLPKLKPDPNEKPQRRQSPTVQTQLPISNQGQEVRKRASQLTTATGQTLPFDLALYLLTEQPSLLIWRPDRLAQRITQLCAALDLTYNDVVWAVLQTPEILTAIPYRLQREVDVLANALEISRLQALGAVLQQPALLQASPSAIRDWCEQIGAAVHLPSDAVVQMVLKAPGLLEVEPTSLRLRAQHVANLLGGSGAVLGKQTPRTDARRPPSKHSPEHALVHDPKAGTGSSGQPMLDGKLPRLFQHYPEVLLPSAAAVGDNFTRLSHLLGWDTAQTAALYATLPTLLAVPADDVNRSINGLCELCGMQRVQREGAVVSAHMEAGGEGSTGQGLTSIGRSSMQHQATDAYSVQGRPQHSRQEDGGTQSVHNSAARISHRADAFHGKQHQANSMYQTHQLYPDDTETVPHSAHRHDSVLSWLLSCPDALLQPIEVLAERLHCLQLVLECKWGEACNLVTTDLRYVGLDTGEVEGKLLDLERHLRLSRSAVLAVARLPNVLFDKTLAEAYSTLQALKDVLGVSDPQLASGIVEKCPKLLGEDRGSLEQRLAGLQHPLGGDAAAVKAACLAQPKLLLHAEKVAVLLKSISDVHSAELVDNLSRVAEVVEQLAAAGDDSRGSTSRNTVPSSGSPDLSRLLHAAESLQAIISVLPAPAVVRALETAAACPAVLDMSSAQLLSNNCKVLAQAVKEHAVWMEEMEGLSPVEAGSLMLSSTSRLQRLQHLGGLNASSLVSMKDAVAMTAEAFQRDFPDMRTA